MDGALKKGVVLLLVLFAGWFLITDPSTFAEVVGNGLSAVWGGILSLFGALRSVITS